MSRPAGSVARSESGIRAVIWDFDGTLVDSRHRNLSVNRAIVQELTGLPWRRFEAVTSIEAYDAAVTRCTNWREFYAREFGLTVEQIDAAARLWPEAQMRDATPVPAFEGIPEALEALEDLPQGIVSQNSARIISSVLEGLGLRRRFGPVIGYEAVAFGRQKPAPDGLIECLDRLTGLAPGTAFYIGDHPTDTLCARRAQVELEERGLEIRVVSVAALFGDGSSRRWELQPDAAARSASEIVEIVRNGAPPACRSGREPGREPEGQE